VKTLTASKLRELLDYNATTGKFRWRTTGKGRCRINGGDQPGYIGNHGYRSIGVLGREYLAHRLAWLYVYGDWPSKFTDHINLNKLDNRITNLRAASKSQNSANRRAPKSNTSGFKGVCWSWIANKWLAGIMVNGKAQHLGYFSTREAAHLAYRAAAKRIYGEFSRA
jgi:hypothetical protein